VLAGRASLRELATQTGRSYPYLVGVPARVPIRHPRGFEEWAKLAGRNFSGRTVGGTDGLLQPVRA